MKNLSLTTLVGSLFLSHAAFAGGTVCECTFENVQSVSGDYVVSGTLQVTQAGDDFQIKVQGTAVDSAGDENDPANVNGVVTLQPGEQLTELPLEGAVQDSIPVKLPPMNWTGPYSSTVWSGVPLPSNVSGAQSGSDYAKAYTMPYPGSAAQEDDKPRDFTPKGPSSNPGQAKKATPCWMCPVKTE